MTHDTPGREPERVLVTDIARDLVPGAVAFREIPRNVLGYLTFKWLMAFAALLVVLLALYAATTYPQAADVSGTGLTGGQALEVLATQRAVWLTSVKELGQSYLIGPVLPLLGTVLGYLLGRNRESSSG